jgi:hypothetical protein
MKLPTSTKPTSGFHICDILELNKDNHQKKQQSEEKLEEDEKSRADENCDDDEVEMKRENLSSESDENLAKNENCIKRKHSPSPTSPTRESQSPRLTSREIKNSKKQQKHETSDHHQLLTETIHQYPHLFQNHPAMRPWFNSNGKFHSNAMLVSIIKMEH